MLALALAFPIDDWQFWAATGIFALAAAFLVRKFLPIVGLRRSRSTQRRVTLTIERNRPGDPPAN